MDGNMEERVPGRRGSALVAILVAVAAGVLVMSWSSAFAAPIEVGVHGGLSIPNIRGNTELSRHYESRLGPFFGLTADFPLAGLFHLCAEINYASQGGRRDGLQPIPAGQMEGLPFPPGLMLYADFDNETVLDYLEVPILLRAISGGRFRLFAEAGPFVGFRVRSITITGGTGPLCLDPAGTMPLPMDPVCFDNRTNISDDVHSVNAGFAVGAGVQSRLGPGNVILGLRVSYGLTNIQPNPEVNGRNHTGALVILAGYTLPLGRF
jgi:hypothetical protein